MNAMNTSLSDLFKGFEEHKEGIEGNTKNEEWLKLLRITYEFRQVKDTKHERPEEKRNAIQ